jgi:hypothetical protein
MPLPSTEIIVSLCYNYFEYNYVKITMSLHYNYHATMLQLHKQQCVDMIMMC